MFQTYLGSNTQKMRINLQSGEIGNLTEQFEHFDLGIEDIEADGRMTGIVTTNNYNTFFYSQGEDIRLVQPPHEEDFIIKDYTNPIPAVLVQAKD